MSTADLGGHPARRRGPRGPTRAGRRAPPRRRGPGIVAVGHAHPPPRSRRDLGSGGRPECRGGSGAHRRARGAAGVEAPGARRRRRRGRGRRSRRGSRRRRRSAPGRSSAARAPSSRRPPSRRRAGRPTGRVKKPTSTSAPPTISSTPANQNSEKAAACGMSEAGKPKSFIGAVLDEEQRGDDAQQRRGRAARASGAGRSTWVSLG